MVFPDVVVWELVGCYIGDGLGVYADNLRLFLAHGTSDIQLYLPSACAPPPQRVRRFQAYLLVVIDKFATMFKGKFSASKSKPKAVGSRFGESSSAMAD